MSLRDTILSVPDHEWPPTPMAGTEFDATPQLDAPARAALAPIARETIEALPPEVRATIDAILVALVESAERQRDALAMLSTLVGQLEGAPAACTHPDRAEFETFAGRKFVCPDCGAEGEVR